MSVLEVGGCSVRFGGVQALHDVSLAGRRAGDRRDHRPQRRRQDDALRRHQRLLPARRGQRLVPGPSTSPSSPVHERAALGMGRTFQNVGLVKGATVRANLLTAQHLEARYSATGRHARPARARYADERRLSRRAEALAEILGLAGSARPRVAGLPYGVLKRVELAAVLATDPDLLLLDEPTSGMGPEEAHAFGATLLELRRTFELTVVMIEHHVPLVAQVCDHVYCLNFGETAGRGQARGRCGSIPR